MFQTKVVENIKTHILCSITFFQKSCCLYEMWKNWSVREATNDNIIWCRKDPTI